MTPFPPSQECFTSCGLQDCANLKVEVGFLFALFLFTLTFETESKTVAQAVLELKILLLLWSHKC